MNLIKALMVITAFSLAASASAAPISRAAFGASAVEYGFDGASIGAVNVSSGILSVSGGNVATLDRGPLTLPTYYDGGDSSVIRFDFSSLISAFGIDFNSNNQNTTLSVFGLGGGLLESFTLGTGSQTPCDGFLCGYIGINVGSNLISFVTIDTPLIGTELFVDNIIYQTPEPASLALVGLGLAGIALRKRQAKA